VGHARLPIDEVFVILRVEDGLLYVSFGEGAHRFERSPQRKGDELGTFTQ
jgi:hypothetical protein